MTEPLGRAKSHLRVVLRVLTRETEAFWAERGRCLTLRRLEALASQERAERCRPGAARVAALAAAAVEMARKVEGYHMGTGQAVAMMTIETMAGISPRPVGSEGGPGGLPGRGAGPAGAVRLPPQWGGSIPAASDPPGSGCLVPASSRRQQAFRPPGG